MLTAGPKPSGYEPSLEPTCTHRNLEGQAVEAHHTASDFIRGTVSWIIVLTSEFCATKLKPTPISRSSDTTKD